MKSLKSKLLLNMISIILAVSLVSLVISAFLNQENTVNTLRDSLTETAKVAAARIETEIDGYKRLLYTFSQDPTIRNTTAPAEARLNRLTEMASIQQFTTFGIADEAGKTTDGRDVSQATYFTNCKSSGRTYVSDPIVSSDKTSAEIIMAAPILVDKQFKGIIFVGKDAKFLSDVTDSIDVGKTGNAAILNKNGTTIGFPDYQLVLDQYNTQNEVANDPQLERLAAIERQMMNGETNNGEYFYGGNEKIMAFAPIANSDGWSIDVAAVKKDFFDGLYKTIFWNAVVSIIMVIISVLIVIRMAGNIATPIRKCVDRLVLLSNGDLHTEVPRTNAKDETHTLLEALNTTIESLQEDVNDVAYHLGQFADGNLSAVVERDYQGDFKPMEDAIKRIGVSLNSSISQIGQAAEQVATASDQVASGAMALSEGASQQASSVEELAATIEEISGQIKNNASDAQDASFKVETVGMEMENSNKKMKALVDAMGEIDNRSNEISRIIKTIEDISFQTNILALNAAVEAARAGAAGKGFAVVADEVRNLASKSSEAAKNTTALIEGSLHAVKNGTQIADETAQSLITVVEGTKEVIETVNRISEASNEQATSISQITVGIDQISSVVQTNSATSEESAATSKELSDQAQILKQLVGAYRLAGSAKSGVRQLETNSVEDFVPLAPSPDDGYSKY